MRRSVYTLAALLIVASASATQLPLPKLKPANPAKPLSDPSFPQPGSLLSPDRMGTPSTQGMTLADALTLEKKAGVWWEYARDISSVTARLNAIGLTRSTLLVPVDSAIMKLPCKPHQNRDGSDETDESARRNVEAFLSAHIIPGTIGLGAKEEVETVSGSKVQILKDESKEEGWKVWPDEVEVVGVKDASNGRILYLNGVLNY